MSLDDFVFDFDIGNIFENISNVISRTVRIIFMMFFNLPTSVKITLAILLVLSVIGIGYLTWKYRHEWQYVKY